MSCLYLPIFVQLQFNNELNKKYMKGQENKKEKKKEKAADGQMKVLSEYQKSKQSKQNTSVNTKG